MWITLLRTELISERDRFYVLANSLATAVGFSIVLSNRRMFIWAPLYATLLVVCCLLGLLGSAEALATMSWRFPPIYGELAPLWSPIRFLTTRFALLSYLDQMNVGLARLEAFCAVTTGVLFALRFAGYRVVTLENQKQFREGACNLLATGDSRNTA